MAADFFAMDKTLVLGQSVKFNYQNDLTNTVLISDATKELNTVDTGEIYKDDTLKISNNNSSFSRSKIIE